MPSRKREGSNWRTSDYVYTLAKSKRSVRDDGLPDNRSVSINNKPEQAMTVNERRKHYSSKEATSYSQSSKACVTDRQTNEARVAKNSGFNPNCKYCIRERKDREARRNKKAANKRQPRQKRSRVSKSRKRKSFGRVRPINGYQYRKMSYRNNIPMNLCSFSKRVKNFDASHSKNLSGKPVDSRDNLDHSNDSNVSKSDVASVKYPDTSDPSVTTYNSFLSMDHEPMVSE